MSRVILWLAAVAALFVPGAISVRAQTPGNLVSQVVDGPTGYQYAVPSDWQQVPVWLKQRNFDQMLTVDGQVASPDNNQHVRVETGSGFGASPDKVHDTITSFLQGPPGGGPAFTVFATPSPVQVANADAAEAGAASYNDPGGNPRIVAARLAVRGGTTYMLVVDSTADFYRNSPLLGQIEESFKLTAPSSNP